MSRKSQLRRRTAALRLAAPERLEPILASTALPLVDGLFALSGSLPTASAVSQPNPLATTSATTGSSLDPVGAAALRARFGFNGTGQTVAVIDSGIAADHHALGGGYGPGFRVVGGYDFAERDDRPFDDGPMGSHGTHVAGLVGGSDTNFSGVAPGVDLVSLRVFDDNGNGDFAWIEQALQWVHDHRHDFRYEITTVNLSVGVAWNATNTPNWTTIEDELALLESDGIFIAVAAGNSFADYNAPGLSYPAASTHVVPVMSVDAAGNLSSFSQRHELAIAAPGQSINSTVPDYVGNFNYRTDDYVRYTGTSMATPFVAGAAVLVREALAFAGATTINQRTINDVLRNSADTVQDSITGRGYLRMNLARAVESVMADATPPTPTPTPTPPTPIPPPPTPPSLPVAAPWGVVDYARHDNLTVSNEAWFSVTAANSATLTVDATFAAGDVELELYNADRQLITSSRGASNTERLDISATAGTSYFIRIAGSNSDIDLRITNLVASNDGVVNVVGSAANDAFTISAGDSHAVSVNGVAYSFPAATTRQINIQAGSGDTLTIIGSSGRDMADVGPDRATLRGSGYEIIATGFAQVNVVGNGGDDSLSLRDTPNNDTLTLDGSSARLESTGFLATASGFRSIVATASGGYDTATFVDTAGDDAFVATADWARMSNVNNVNRAELFDLVLARATRGGYDTATLIRDAAAELVASQPGGGRLRSAGTDTTASAFDAFFAQTPDGRPISLNPTSSEKLLLSRVQRSRPTVVGPVLNIPSSKTLRGVTRLNVSMGPQQLTVSALDAAYRDDEC